MTEKKIKAAALYARFSRNDSDVESDSIDNQRKILQKYAKENGFNRTRFYADDNYTGTSFDRPDFQRMLEDIDKGEIDTVIVKDLSRLGRLSGMVSYFTEFYFPSKLIRFIAVNDNEDSENGYSELMPFKNIFNEWYARDTSRKVRSVLRNKGMSGGILCSKPIYGYRTDPDNKNHWLIDDEAAEVVKMIFDLCTEEHLGITRIANVLREREIITPTEYFRRKGLTKRPLRQPEVFYWDLNTVRVILRNQAYLGDVINFKTYRKSYKDHKMYWNAPEDQVIYKGVNDPIISEEQYRTVQEILDKNRRVPVVREPDLFQGYIYCADCGKRMSLSRAESHNGIASYMCNTYRRNTRACTSHYTRRDAVVSVTLREVRKLLCALKRDPDILQRKLMSEIETNIQKDVKKARKDICKLQQRDKELNKVISQLYEDRALEKISEERYFSMVTEFEEQQKEVRHKIGEYETFLNTSKENSNTVGRFIEAVNKYDNVEELDQYVLLDLVDKIVIKQREEGQEYEDTIEIYFKEIGHIFFEG